MGGKNTALKPSRLNMCGARHARTLVFVFVFVLVRDAVRERVLVCS